MAGRFVYYTGMSVDGRIADPAATLDWLTTSQHDEQGPGGFATFESTIGAIVMGRTTYEWILAHLRGGPWPYQQATWVLTHRHDLEVPAGADVRFTDEPVEVIAEAMRDGAAEGDCWVAGGAQCATAFAQYLDEVIVCVAPAVLGSGTPLLSDPLNLRLESVDRNGDLAILRYAVVR